MVTKIDRIASKAAAKMHKHNKPIATKLTVILRNIVKDLRKMGIKCKLQGLKYKLKTVSSLQDKYSRIMERENIGITKAIKKVKDGVRFSVVFDKEQYVMGVLKLWDKLSEYGYESITRPTKSEIRWIIGDGYQGINMIIAQKGREGVPIEIQFHTKESIKEKEKMHPLYEKLRKECDEKLSLEQFKALDPQSKCVLYKEQLIKAEKKIPIPKKLKKCKTLKKANNRIKDLEYCL